MIVSNPRARATSPETRPQLGLAEVAAVGGIAEVARVGELVGVHLEERDVVAPRQLDCAAPLRFRVRGAPAHDGEKPSRTERLASDDGEQRRIDST